MSKVSLFAASLMAFGAVTPAFANDPFGFNSQFEYALCRPRNPIVGEYNFLNILGAGPMGATRQNGVQGVLFSGASGALEEKAELNTRQLYVAEGGRYSGVGVTALIPRPGTGENVVITNYQTGRQRTFALDAIFVPEQGSGNDSIVIRYFDLDDEIKVFTTSGCFLSNEDLIVRAPRVTL